jgi:DNA-binding MarR family transcriptional regulator
MVKPSSFQGSDVADDLLDLLPSLLRQLRGGIVGETDSKHLSPEWRDISELRATNGQIRLLRIVLTHQRCTMQELADELGVAAPTVTAMVKRLLTQGFVERVRDDHDWRVVWVLPTERGQRAVTLYDEFRRANLQRRLAHLSQEELAHLRATIPILRHLIEVEP